LHANQETTEAREGYPHPCSNYSPQGRENHEGGKPNRIGGFRVASVFDTAQTHGEPLPEAPEHDVTTGGEGLLPKIEAGIRACGIELTYKAIAGGAQGLSRGGIIEIEQEQMISAKCGPCSCGGRDSLSSMSRLSSGSGRRRMRMATIRYSFTVRRPACLSNVVIPNEVGDALRALPNSHPSYFFWSGNGDPRSAAKAFQRSYWKFFKLAKIQKPDGIPKRCHPHMFRDTFAVELLLAACLSIKCPCSWVIRA
jgi:hypothetical protein